MGILTQRVAGRLAGLSRRLCGRHLSLVSIGHLRLSVGAQVELNKSRRADVQEALQDRNILPSKTLPDMKATLAAVIAREKGPRPILIPKTLKVTAGC